MATYSRWRPDGGYDYFETQQGVALGNDLPNPVMPAPTRLGVPSNEVGQKLPISSRRVGSGDYAIGIVVPMDTSQLASFLSNQEVSSTFYWFVAGAGFVGVAWLVYEFGWRRS